MFRLQSLALVAPTFPLLRNDAIFTLLDGLGNDPARAERHAHPLPLFRVAPFHLSGLPSCHKAQIRVGGTARAGVEWNWKPWQPVLVKIFSFNKSTPDSILVQEVIERCCSSTASVSLKRGIIPNHPSWWVQLVQPKQPEASVPPLTCLWGQPVPPGAATVGLHWPSRSQGRRQSSLHNGNAAGREGVRQGGGLGLTNSPTTPYTPFAFGTSDGKPLLCSLSFKTRLRPQQRLEQEGNAMLCFAVSQPPLTTFRPSRTTQVRSLMTWVTSPCLPASFPDRICT